MLGWLLRLLGERAGETIRLGEVSRDADRRRTTSLAL